MCISFNLLLMVVDSILEDLQWGHLPPVHPNNVKLKYPFVIIVQQIFLTSCIDVFGIGFCGMLKGMVIGGRGGRGAAAAAAATTGASSTCL